MNLRQRYLLDSIGCIVIKALLPISIVDSMNLLINGHLKGHRPTKFNILELDPLFMDLLTHPVVLESNSQILGKHFRFDHAFGRQQPTRDGQTENLHGGPWAGNGSLAYWKSGDNIYCGQLAFGFALCKQGGELGGFTYLPGSHKSGFNIEGAEVLSSVLEKNIRHPALMSPELEPGDLTIFFESLVHGTSEWRGQGFRRNLYYMFAPGHSAWRDYESVRTQYLKLARNDLERRLMRGPYVGDFDDKSSPVNGPNRRREPTI